jgi:hypothetical protein
MCLIVFMNSLSSVKRIFRHFNDEIVVGDSVVVDTVVHVPVLGCPCLLRRVGFFGVEYVECGWGGRRVRRNVFLAVVFPTTILKWEVEVFTRFRVALRRCIGFSYGQSLRRHVVTTKNIISGFGFTLCCVVLCCVVFVLCGYALYRILL